ncbi:MAG TPA: M20/M25/M40 family metallo-hydrolase [Verrucomicrobiae bacterium]|nr:M20/M25/M40 family metallo-hydrolase [Verrucomicrobiae bacterium]
MTSTEKLLMELIALPSVNPAFLPSNDPHAGEQRVAEFLASVAANAGLDVEFQAVLPNRANLVARLTPSGPVTQRILLAPHLDTVGAAADGFSPRARSLRIHGRGACDTKGSVAAMLSAVAAIARDGKRPAKTEIVFVGLVDEENAQAGSRGFAQSGISASLAIIGEPTQLKIVTAHKGSLWLRMETRGKAAHGSTPNLGRNAVHEMARIVDLLETKYAAQLRKRRHPLLGSGTINVGTIAGGTQPNIVPSACSIAIDRRTLPGENENSVRREINALLKQHGLRARFDNEKPAPCLPLETDHKIPHVSQFLTSAGQRRPAGVDFFCDAAVLAAAGIPSVVFGPGSLAQAHTDDEWISRSSLNSATALLTRFLRGLP